MKSTGLIVGGAASSSLNPQKSIRSVIAVIVLTLKQWNGLRRPQIAMTTMDVRQLIEHLEKFDPDLPVFDADWEPIVKCHIVEDFPLGDYANPDCEYLDKVLILSNDPNM